MIKFLDRNTRSGFTLIELLVVIAIISLLSSIIFSSLSSARTKARDAQRISILREFQKAMELKFSDTLAYPITYGFLNNPGPGGLDGLNTSLSPYIAANISADDRSRYIQVKKNYSDAGISFCLTTNGWPAGGDASRWAVYVRLENPQTSSSNFVSSTIGDGFDKCVAVTYNMNYRVGN